jgi:glucan phosphorylase
MGFTLRSCVAKSTQELYDRYLGPEWSAAGVEDPLWDKVAQIPDEELWRNHEQRRSHLVVSVRDRLRKAVQERGGSQLELERGTGSFESNCTDYRIRSTVCHLQASHSISARSGTHS